MNQSVLTETQPEKSIIMDQIQKGNADFVFQGLCRVENGVMIISYSFFKCFATEQTYDIITQVFKNKLEELLTEVGKFIIYINMERFSINQFTKHQKYFIKMSTMFQELYPDKLEKCYLYNTSRTITNIYSLMNMIVDKDTIQKVEIVYAG